MILRHKININQVFKIRKETIFKFYEPFYNIFYFKIPIEILPLFYLSNYFIAIVVKYYFNYVYYLSKSLCRLLPIITEIWCRDKKPSFYDELIPFKMAVNFYSGVFLKEILIILMKCSQLIKSPKLQIFLIS